MNTRKRERSNVDLDALLDEIISNDYQYFSNLLSTDDFIDKQVESNHNFPYQINEAAEAKSKTERKTATKSFYNDDDNNNNNVLIDDKAKTETQANNGYGAGQ